MSTTAEHYAIADAQVEQADAQLERLHELATNMSREALDNVSRVIELRLLSARVHATLATVTE